MKKINEQSRRDPRLEALFKQVKLWQQLENQVATLLPPNLKGHFKVACVEGNTLILFANNNMVGSRLKMILPSLVPSLQSINTQIEQVRVKIKPHTEPIKIIKNTQLGPEAVAAIEDGVQQLQHHPELARVLQNFANKQKR